MHTHHNKAYSVINRPGAGRSRISQRRRRGPLGILLCCLEQGRTNPVGASQVGTADRAIYFSRVIRLQARLKNLAQRIFLREFWSPAPSAFFCFQWHKLLTAFYFLCTVITALNLKASPSQQIARTSMERLAIQRHPASTGAGSERLAVNVITYQGASSALKTRSLKIECTGDFFRGKTAPRIRLNGQWLQKAGFLPGNRVEVCNLQPGILTLRQVVQAKEVAS